VTETPKTRARPRRTLRGIFIEPFKQIKLGLYVMGVTLVFVILAGLFYRQAFDAQYAHVMSIFGVVEEALQTQVTNNDIFVQNSRRLAVLFTTFIVVMFTVILRSTHRYYGPLVSIERFIHEIRDGNYHKRVSIRKGDELGRLVNSLNEMATELEKRHKGGVSKDSLAEEHPQ
jgi:HAMP domain-containing protein